MSIIFWLLLLLTVVFTGSFIYRLCGAARDYNKDRDYAIDRPNSIPDENVDLFLLRWAAVFGITTTALGVVEGLVYLMQ